MRILPAEEWRAIPGFQDYDVSNHGRIRSRKWGRERIRRVSIHAKDGHRFIMLSAGPRRHQLVVARLVLLAFIGPPPSAAHVACHDVGGNLNDYLWRLRWDTVQANNRDTVVHGTHFAPRGSSHHFASLTERKVVAIRRRLAAGESQTSIAKRLKLSQGTISRVATRKSWKHVA